MSPVIRIVTAPCTFLARPEVETAPQTWAAFQGLLPYHQQLIHARRSGEACGIPMGDFHLSVAHENLTGYLQRGEILFYPTGFSETEILFPYGSPRFASKVGQLAVNHFLTVVEGAGHRPELGHLYLLHGARALAFKEL
jgi:hypothetical protein